MAGPEPYPQEKWTREQEEAYAEGRRSAKQSAGGGKGTATRSGRKRYVRTSAGSKRYKVPIGAEIGSARNAKAAEAQKDTESTGRYRDLVGQDQTAQAKAMAGLDPDQLKRLAAVAYSFRSSDPNVVRLRIGVANELRRRGLNINDFGGLGGNARSATPVSVKVHKPAPVRKAAPVAPVRKVTSAMTARRNDRKLRELSVPQLRRALGAFGKMPRDKREVVARYLVNQAIELSATHMLGNSVIEAAGRTPAQVIELAGKWKHGWIPLDGTAMRAKMKGGNGKPWWSGGKQGRRGSSTHARSVEAGRIVRARKASAKSGGDGKAAPFVGVPKKGGSDEGRGSSARKGVVSNKDTKNRYAATHITHPEARKALVEGRAKEAARKTRKASNRATNKASNEANRKVYFDNLSDADLKKNLADWSRPGMTTNASERAHLKRLRAEAQRRGLAGKA